MTIKVLHINREIYLSFFFLIIQSFITSNAGYLVILLIYLLSLYYISRDIFTTLWMGLLFTLPFHRAKYFSQAYVPPSSFYQGSPVSFDFFISFTDFILFCILFVVIKYKDQFKLVVSKKLIITIVFIIFLSVVSAFFSIYPLVSFFASAQLVKYFIIFLFSTVFLSRKSFLDVTLQFIHIFTIYLSSLIILEVINGGQLGLAVERLGSAGNLGRHADELSGLYRAAGIADDPNFSASMLLMLFPFIFTNIFIKKTWVPRNLSMVTFLFLMIALFFTYSRAIWIGAIVISILMFICLKKQKVNILIPKLLKRFSKMLLFVVMVASPLIFLRLSSLSTAFSEFGGGSYRAQHMFIAANLFRTRPWFGHGLNSFQYITISTLSAAERFYDFSEPHNVIAQVGSELGFFGLLLVGYLFINFMKVRYQKFCLTKKSLHLAVAGSTFAYILCISVYPWFIYPGISELFWVLVGISYEINS